MGIVGTVEVDRFKARSDDGKYKTEIVVYEDRIDARTHQKGEDTIGSGLLEAVTVDGFHCNHQGDGVFEVLDPRALGVLVRRLPEAG